MVLHIFGMSGKLLLLYDKFKDSSHCQFNRIQAHHSLNFIPHRIDPPKNTSFTMTCRLKLMICQDTAVESAFQL